MDIKEEDKMAFNDLREFIERLEEEDELIRIKKLVDWDLEAGGIARRATELKAPAPLFENIKDYPGYRLLSAQVGPSAKKDRYYCRMAMAMEMKPESGPEEIIEEYIKRKSNPIKPVLVSNGPCKENIFIEDNVDLERFPVPIIHEGDGGRYIGSWHAVATKDLDTEWVNWGMYRLMLHDKETMGSVIVPPQHIGRMFFQKYEPKNLPMEFAVIIGAEPITPMIAGSPIPAGINEMDIIGAIRGKPLDVVKCETVDLVVPATAEIIIEGEVLPNTRLDEGPFGEYVGYRASKRKDSFQSDWEIRPLWILPADMNNPDYNYSKRIFYVEKEDKTFFIHGIDNYDMKGRLWKCIFAFGITNQPGTRLRTWHGGFYKDHLNNHTTLSDIDPIDPKLDKVRIPLKYFTIKGLLRKAR